MMQSQYFRNRLMIDLVLQALLGGTEGERELKEK